MTLPLVWTGIFGAALFGFTLTWNDFDRTVLLVLDNTLPLQIVGLIQASAIRPDLYALGTATTLVTLSLIFSVLIAVTIRLRLRGRRGAAGRGGARPRRRDRRRGGFGRAVVELRMAASGRRRLDRGDDRDASGAGHGQARPARLRRRARRDCSHWPDAPPLELDDFRSVPSFDVHGELALVARPARRRARGSPDVRGVVVPHGTDTMEENVYLVDRLLAAETPVVFTGAQRGADRADADGPRNLRDAIRLAGSGEAAGSGAVVVFAGEIHAAREARKAHTSAVRAFDSPATARSATSTAAWSRAALAACAPRRCRCPSGSRRSTCTGSTPGATAGSSGTRCATGAEAIVLEGTGRGNANDQVVEAVREATVARRSRRRLLSLRGGSG